MKKALRWTALAIVAFTVTACPKYKPYLEERYRVPAQDPDGTFGGVFTGKKGKYVIYGR
jgi:hypothetical protein